MNELSSVVWEVPDCCICGSKDRTIYRDLEELLLSPRIPFHTVRCKECKHVYLSPRPDLASIGRFYPKDYGPHRDEVAFATNERCSDRSRGNASDQIERKSGWLKLIPGLRAFVRWLLDSQSEIIPIPTKPGLNALEIGCGAGRFMQSLENAGWNVQGIEPALEPSERCRSRGMSVTTGNIESMDLQAESQDAVFAWMVIEHVHDPQSTFNKIANSLKPGGVFLFSVPNFGCWEPKLLGRFWYGFQLVHLNYFTVDELDRMLQKAGLEVECVYHQPSVRNIVGSLGLMSRERFGMKRLGTKLVDFAADMSMWWQLILAPMARFLSLIKQSGRITLQARKPSSTGT